MSGHHLVGGQADPIAEKLATDNAKKHRSSGSRPMSIGERVKLTAKADFWWWLHLSRLTMRVMIQAAQKDGRSIESAQSLEHLNRGWTEGMRRFAEAHAYRLGQHSEPDEVAKLSEIPSKMPDGSMRPVAMVQRDRAVFLSRWFTVPKPGEVGPASWTQAELRQIARSLVNSVDANSEAWPTYPDGWRESLMMVREETEKRR